MILRARHVLAAPDGLIDNGALRIHEGRIAEVGPAAGLAGEPVTDLGDGLLLPGLVNAHTHLELTHLAGRLPPRGNFADWVGRLVDALQADGDRPDVVRQAVAGGRAACLAQGTTVVGDISRLPNITRPELAGGPLRVLSFGEVIAFGRLRHRLAERLEAAVNGGARSEFLEVGVSPHAPYTLEPDGLRTCVGRAVACGLRLCMHLAESREEAAFTERLSGPIREYFERHGLWDGQVPRPGLSPIEYAAATGVLGPDTLLAHVNYAGERDIRRLAGAGAHVVYCPRTHQAFGHQPHPFRSMLDAGVNVCLGTDSLASNPSLSVLDELRFLRSVHPDLPGRLLLDMATIRGARALGLERLLGSISVGKQADLVFVPLAERSADDPLEQLLSGPAYPSAVWVGGRPVL